MPTTWIDRCRLLLLLVLCSAGASGQAAFPYPELPAALADAPARMAYLLQHYWSRYAFRDTTQQNQMAAEQGFVNFIDLMQRADSAVCARAAQALADSISADAGREAFFMGLAEHYLAARSPMRDDVVYAHLLRALPPTDERQSLLGQLDRNQRGAVAADIALTTADGGHAQRLYDVSAPLTLVVFHSPLCDHCRQMMPLIGSNETVRQNADRLAVVYVDVEQTPDAYQAYYLPVLPALYLMDGEKRVLVKDGTMATVAQAIADRPRQAAAPQPL